MTVIDAIERAVPPALRSAAQVELRDRDLTPLRVIHRVPGPACREALKALETVLANVRAEEERKILGEWLGPSMRGAAWHPAPQAAQFVLARLLTPGFLDVRAVFDRDDRATGRALDAVSGLRDAHDDDRLVPLAFFDETTPYYLRRGGHYLHYHPFLRRYLAAAVNIDFTTRLLRAAAVADLDVRVALDGDRLTDSPLLRSMERDYWWGPKLTLVSLDDPHAHGVTVHERLQDPARRWAWPLLRTEFRWTSADGQKWMEIEELSPPSAPRAALAHGSGVSLEGGLVLNRYLHTQRDIEERRFTHLDGAIRGYEAARYQARLDSRIDVERKAARYRKVFRVDGPIADDLWYDLVVMFYRQNEMVGEYLHPGFQAAMDARTTRDP